MNDTEKIQTGQSLTLYDELIKDRPENIIRRTAAFDTATADRFASDIGDEKINALFQATKTDAIIDSIMTNR